MDTLKFPIRFTVGRQIEKVKDGTDDFIRQLISVCILTEPYVLPLTPEFGTADPSFSTVSPSSLMLNVSKFIPEISLLAVTPSVSADSGTINVRFIYNR